MRGIWPMDTKPLSQVMVEQQMEVFQSVVMAIRKIKSSMRVKNTDQIRIDAVLPEDELISMHLSGNFEDDIRRLTRVTTFHCPPWEDERPERTEDQYLGTVELPCGGHVAGWTSEAGLRTMLERFP